LRGQFTVKLVELLADMPLTVTMINPVVAPVGTLVTMVVLVALVSVADVPLKVMVLLARVESNPVPVMVTDVPVEPLVGVKLVMVGTTEKFDDVDTVSLSTVTLTGPDVAPVGTVVTIVVLVALVTVAVVPLNLTVLLAAVVLKPEPVIVTVSPMVPLDGEKEVMASDDDPQPAKTSAANRIITAKQRRKPSTLFMMFFLFETNIL
jgi:hypothetical protein